MEPYEKRLRLDHDWALHELSRHFEDRSCVQLSLRRIAARLTAHRISYAVIGGMALFNLGHRRFSQDIDILVTIDGLQQALTVLVGNGYSIEKPQRLRDDENGVAIKFYITGKFPGDGKPKPVAFPDPATASVEINGIRFIRLEQYIELKLTSGMTNLARMKDLGDMVELIRSRRLKADLAAQLHPHVRDKYLEFVHAVENDTYHPHGFDFERE